jgi:hypothetical protein
MPCFKHGFARVSLWSHSCQMLDCNLHSSALCRDYCTLLRYSTTLTGHTAIALLVVYTAVRARSQGSHGSVGTVLTLCGMSAISQLEGEVYQCSVAVFIILMMRITWLATARSWQSEFVVGFNSVHMSLMLIAVPATKPSSW